MSACWEAGLAVQILLSEVDKVKINSLVSWNQAPYKKKLLFPQNLIKIKNTLKLKLLCIEKPGKLWKEFDMGLTHFVNF